MYQDLTRIGRNTRKYGSNDLNGTFRIGLYENHYFIIDQTKYTTFSIKNYQQLHNLPRWNEIYNNKMIEIVIDSPIHLIFLKY